MQVYPQNNKGFALDHDLAEQFGILDELLTWEEEYNELPFFEVFEERFGLEPDKIQHFKYERGSSIQGLQGFEYDLTYVLFETNTENYYPDEWNSLLARLEEYDIDLIEGSWAELG